MGCLYSDVLFVLDSFLFVNLSQDISGAHIKELVGEAEYHTHLQAVIPLGPKGAFQQLSALAAELMVRIIPAKRQQIIRDLVLVALADGVLDDKELDAITEVAALFKVGPEFVETTVDELGLHQTNGGKSGEMPDYQTFAPRETV